MKIKIRPAILLISLGLIVALVISILTHYEELAKVIVIGLVASLSKLVESEEVSGQ